MKTVGRVETGDFVVLVGAAQPILQAGGVPEEIEILPYPVWETDDGTLVTDDESQRAVVEHFRRRRTKLVIDYEHQTLEGTEAPAAGWLTDLIPGGERGLRGRTSWTPRGAQYVANREYDYHSPVVAYQKSTRRVLMLHSLALTNTPKTQNQIPLSQQLVAKALAEFQGRNEEEPMKELIAKLKTVLGAGFATLSCKSARGLLGELTAAIPDSDEMLAAKLEGTPKNLFDALGVIEASAAKPAAPEVLAILELPEGASLAQIEAKIVELKTPSDMVPKAEHERLATELRELKAKGEQQTIDQFIEANRSKIPPAREAFVRESFKRHGMDHVRQMVAAFKEELPKGQAGGDPTKPAEQEVVVARKVNVRGRGELEVDPDSATRAAKITAIQKEKGCDYRTAAQELRKREDAGA